jgi:hypothetical protein
VEEVKEEEKEDDEGECRRKRKLCFMTDTTMILGARIA